MQLAAILKVKLEPFGWEFEQTRPIRTFKWVIEICLTYGHPRGSTGLQYRVYCDLTKSSDWEQPRVPV